MDNNVNVILNSKGSLNHITVGMAHEFGHVILFLNGEPSGHGEPGVDSFVYSRASEMSKRLGYDRQSKIRTEILLQLWSRAVPKEKVF